MLPCFSCLPPSLRVKWQCLSFWIQMAHRLFTRNSNWYAVSPSFSQTHCSPVSPAACGGSPLWVLVFTQVLQLDLCYRSPHGHTADRLTRQEYCFSLFTLASQVWALLRAILEVLNFCHFDSFSDPHQDGRINTHSFSFFLSQTHSHTRRQTDSLSKIPVIIHMSYTHTHHQQQHNPTLPCQQNLVHPTTTSPSCHETAAEFWHVNFSPELTPG